MQKAKKYGWPILALILFILFLLCHWQGEPQQTVPPPDDEPGTWAKVDMVSGGCEVMDFDTTNTETIYFDITEHWDKGDSNYRIEFEHWWDEWNGNVCTFPCPTSTRWKVYDSDGFLVHSLNEQNPVNTFGNPEILQGSWDGRPWKITFENSCNCMLSYDWEINVYAYGVN